MRDVPAPRRGDPGHLLADLVELLDPDEQQPGQVRSTRASPSTGGGQLLREEGVALGAGDQPPQLLLVDVVRSLRAHEVPDVRVGQRGEVHPVDLPETRPVRQRRPQRVPAVQLVAAVGRDERQRCIEPPREQQRQQVTRGLVRPVHVLDDDEEAAVRPEVLEDGVKGLEQLAPVQRLLPGRDGARDRARDGAGPRACCTTRAPQPRHEPGDLRMGRDEVLRAVGVCRVQPAEQLGEGEVGEAAARLPEAVPGEDPDPSRAGLCHQLREHPGLADPRVPETTTSPPTGASAAVSSPVRRLRRSRSARRPKRGLWGAASRGTWPIIAETTDRPGLSLGAGRCAARVPHVTGKHRGPATSGARLVRVPARATTGHPLRAVGDLGGDEEWVVGKVHDGSFGRVC